jgi:hypothetical protein
MNANYAYQQGLLEGAGLTQNQPKRKSSPVKMEQDFRKRGYKKFNPTANIAEDLSEGEESETITNDDDDIVQPSNVKSITGDNTLGTIHTSQEVVDPFGQRILSPKRGNLDHHDLLWPVDPTWSRSIIPMETDRGWRSYDDIDLSQYHQSSSIISEDNLKYTNERSSGNLRIRKQPRQEEDDTFNDLPLELIGNDNVINYSAYLRKIMAAQKEMQQHKNKDEKVINTISSILMLTNKTPSYRKPNMEVD